MSNNNNSLRFRYIFIEKKKCFILSISDFKEFNKLNTFFLLLPN